MLSENDIIEICTKCANLVNKKYNYVFDVDELKSVGCCHLLQLPEDKTTDKLRYSETYFSMMRYAYHTLADKRHLKERYAQRSKRYEPSIIEAIDISDAWRSLSEFDQDILYKYLIEGRTYNSLCSDYGKNNGMSIKILVDKAKARLQQKLSGYKE